MKLQPLKIYIVEDDAFYGAMLEHTLNLNPDYQTKKFTSATAFLNSMHEVPDIVTLDYSLPDMQGDLVLKQIKQNSPETCVVVVSGQEDINVAIDLIKKGADDYLVKDNDTQNRLWLTVQKLREKIELKKELASLKEEVAKKYEFQKVMIGNSPAIKQVFHIIEKASKTNINLSVTGETGTGKDLVAKSIHFNSPRKNHPFVPVNVAAIPKELLESEIFGHEKGAFTGAVLRRIGKFEEAHRGTLFLDEIAEMDLNMQTKLLRVLQEKEINRVGGNETIKVDVRIIVATNKNLAEEVKKGRFREDLYYRVIGMPISVPALRERGNDIILIANHFIDLFCAENNLPQKVLSVDAKLKLLGHSFPGNIRELKSVVELACVMCDGSEIAPEHISMMSSADEASFMLGNGGTLKEFTNKIIQHYLDHNQYDVLKVAKLLDVGKSTIYRMIQNNELIVNNRY